MYDDVDDDNHDVDNDATQIIIYCLHQVEKISVFFNGSSMVQLL